MVSWLRHVDAIAWKRRPIQLTFFVTRRCNARCPFCFYLQSAEAAEPHSAELSLAEIAKVSRSLGSLLWLAFSGGEIFLREDLVEISRLFHRQNRPSIMLYPTNGLLPQLIHDSMAQILRLCSDSIVVVKLSLDGVGTAHDALRRTPGGFDQLMQTYRLLAGLLGDHPNFELGVNTVFCSENQDRMDEIIEFVQRMEHIRTHTVSLARGHLANAGYKAVDHAKYERAVGRLAANLRERKAPTYAFRGARLKAAQDILQRRLIHRTLLEQRRLIPCYAGRLNLVLSETGEVYPCETRLESFGNMRAHGYDLGSVVRTAAARATLGSIGRGECHCTHECYFITNILFNPRCYPALAEEWLRLRPARARPDQGAGETARAVPTAKTGSSRPPAQRAGR
jgi:MoaA/NifB/PqqE/SkfB family radical SAM enzyme